MSQAWVVLFPNNTAAMRAERVLCSAGISGRLVPVPRNLSCRCGVALRLDAEAVTPAMNAIRAARVPVSGVYYVRN